MLYLGGSEQFICFQLRDTPIFVYPSCSLQYIVIYEQDPEIKDIPLSDSLNARYPMIKTFRPKLNRIIKFPIEPDNNRKKVGKISVFKLIIFYNLFKIITDGNSLN